MSGDCYTNFASCQFYNFMCYAIGDRRERHICTTGFEFLFGHFCFFFGKSAFRNWCSDASVTTYLKWSPHSYPLITEQVVLRWVREYSDPYCLHWAITRKSHGDVIGGVSLTIRDTMDERAELGYSLGSAFWKQGYGSEAVQAVLDYGFDRVGLHRIEAFCDSQNQASAALLCHLGLQQEGLHRGMCRLASGVFVDCLSFGLCAEERQKPAPIPNMRDDLD